VPITNSTDTICAVATPAGKGGISVVKLSGSKSAYICQKITGAVPAPRTVSMSWITDCSGNVIDQAIILFFSTPHSYTGEDVCEFHVHGSPVVVDLILSLLLELGARLARPGEFSERAFLNGKIDLAQAEAVSDLIDSSSIVAARLAIRSLNGDFSRLINTLVASIINLRVYVEAAIDFPEEEVDFLNSGSVADKVDRLLDEVGAVLKQAEQGVVIKEGIRVVIAGEPNAGKSTLLNALSGMESAIVTEIPGTTRDLLRQEINIGGLPLHIIDTAGLRESDDIVEQEGIRRAWKAIEEADRILLIVDWRHSENFRNSRIWQRLNLISQIKSRITVVFNKIDLSDKTLQLNSCSDFPTISISAKELIGLDRLREHLQECAGFIPEGEGGFIARRRHLDSLLRTQLALSSAKVQLHKFKAGELVAEELRNAQQSLSEITGIVTADDLLGEIFGSFCIGK